MRWVRYRAGMLTFNEGYFPNFAIGWRASLRGYYIALSPRLKWSNWNGDKIRPRDLRELKIEHR